MSAWQRLKSFSGQNRSTPGTSNRQERGSHDAQPRDSSSKNSQAPPADHLTYRHRMIENVPRQHAAQRAAVRSCCGQGQLCSMPGRGWHAARLVLTWLNRLVRCYWFCCARAMGEWSPPINQQEEIGMEATVEAPSAQTTPSQVSHRAAPPAITAWCLDRSGAHGVELHVPRRGREVVFIHDGRGEAALPQVPSPGGRTVNVLSLQTHEAQRIIGDMELWRDPRRGSLCHRKPSADGSSLRQLLWIRWRTLMLR